MRWAVRWTEATTIGHSRPLQNLYSEETGTSIICKPPYWKVIKMFSLARGILSNFRQCGLTYTLMTVRTYKVRSALKLLCSGCKFVKRKGRLRVICKNKKTHKQKQGWFSLNFGGCVYFCASATSSWGFTAEWSVTNINEYWSCEPWPNYMYTGTGAFNPLTVVLCRSSASWITKLLLTLINTDKLCTSVLTQFGEEAVDSDRMDYGHLANWKSLYQPPLHTEVTLLSGFLHICDRGIYLAY